MFISDFSIKKTGIKTEREILNVLAKNRKQRIKVMLKASTPPC